MRVLIIDDSEVARAYMRRTLLEAGATVLEQPSAIGATRNIVEHRIDAVVVDVTMPGLSGDKLVNVLKSNPRLEGLVVVLVSGKSMEELAIIKKTTRADAVLSKEDIETRLPQMLSRLCARATNQRTQRLRASGDIKHR